MIQTLKEQCEYYYPEEKETCGYVPAKCFNSHCLKYSVNALVDFLQDEITQRDEVIRQQHQLLFEKVSETDE